MSQEVRIKGYYSNLYDENFVSTNMCCRLGMEFLLSHLLFKGDLSRVVYSKEDIAFRRRIETVGAGDIKDDTYNYINLNLPYAVYSQTGTYEPDDRGSTQNAGQIVLGQMQPDSGLIIKAAAVKVQYEATAFFARRDDVNVASQLLYWESQPKFPLYYTVQHELAGWPIDIPVFITLDSFDPNTDYNEKDWLEKAKIFPVKCKFTIRSYQTLIENIDEVIPLPIRFSGLYGYNNEKVVYTQKTSLIWADSKWAVDNQFDEKIAKELRTDTTGVHIHLPQDYDPKYIDIDQRSSVELEELQSDGSLLSLTMVDKDVEVVVADAVAGYFTDDRDCILDEYHQVDEKTTENEVTIEWKIKEVDIPAFHSLTLYIPGIYREEIVDVNQTTFTFDGFHPGSNYDCTLIVTSKNYHKLTYKLNLKTKGEPVLGKKLPDNLVGKTFQIPTTFTGKKLSDFLVNKEFKKD